MNVKFEFDCSGSEIRGVCTNFGRNIFGDSDFKRHQSNCEDSCFTLVLRNSIPIKIACLMSCP